MRTVRLTMFALMGALLLGPAAGVAGAKRLDLSFRLTSHKPASPTGAVLHIVYPDDGPGGKPKPVSKGVYEFPAGTTFDLGAIPTCGASDAQFDLLGDAACPPQTALGGGGITVDSGFGAPFDPMALDDSYFLGPGQLITVFRAHGTPGPTLQVNRLKIDGSTIYDQPQLPPGYPPGTKTVAKQVDQEITLAGSGGRAFMTTPGTCPQSGQWIARLTITYEDGSIDSETSATPCERPVARSAGVTRRHPLRRRHRRLKVST